jgi:hypothetical protein
VMAAGVRTSICALCWLAESQRGRPRIQPSSLVTLIVSSFASLIETILWPQLVWVATRASRCIHTFQLQHTHKPPSLKGRDKSHVN